MRPGNGQLTGIGGWLLLLVVGLMVLGPLHATGTLFGELDKAEAATPQLVGRVSWHNFKLTLWSALAVFAAISISAGYRLWKNHEPSSVNFAIYALWIVGPASVLLMGFLLPVLFVPIRFADIAADMVGAAIPSALHAAIWTAYLKRSVRVKNTYNTWF